MKEKLIINLNYNPTPLFFVIFLLIITLGVSSPVYTKAKKQEHKGKSNSFSSSSSTQSKKMPQYRSRSAPSRKPSRSSPPPRVEKNNRSGRWGNNSPKQDRSNKLGVKTGKFIRHPRKPPPDPPKPIPKPPPKKPPKPRPPWKRCPDNGYWCPGGPIGPPTWDDYEEDLESPDPGNTFTPGESNGIAGKEYHISGLFVPDRMLVKKIEEYNAAHLHSLGLEYPLTARSESLTYQLLDSLELIEHMDKKIAYYKQQLDAVRNSNLSPAEKSSRELFWLERIERLEESKRKEEDRASELRSHIEEENKKLE